MELVNATIEQIDYELFKKQKEAVVGIIEDRSGHISDKEQELLDGLVGLLDAITDDILKNNPHLED